MRGEDGGGRKEGERGRGKGKIEGEGKIATRRRFVASTEDTSV